MSSNPFKSFTFHVGATGPSGDITGSATLTDHETRITTLEGNTPPTVLNDLTNVSGTPSTGDLLQYDGSGWVPYTPDSITVTTGLSFVIDGGGSAITSGAKGMIEVPFAGTITRWTVVADVSGSIEIDIWKDFVSSSPPTSGDTITGSDRPRLTSASWNVSTALTGWTTAVSTGDILRFNVVSASTVTNVLLALRITREVGP